MVCSSLHFRTESIFPKAQLVIAVAAVVSATSTCSISIFHMARTEHSSKTAFRFCTEILNSIQILLHCDNGKYDFSQIASRCWKWLPQTSKWESTCTSAEHQLSSSSSWYGVEKSVAICHRMHKKLGGIALEPNIITFASSIQIGRSKTKQIALAGSALSPKRSLPSTGRDEMAP